MTKWDVEYYPPEHKAWVLETLDSGSDPTILVVTDGDDWWTVRAQGMALAEATVVVTFFVDGQPVTRMTLNPSGSTTTWLRPGSKLSAQATGGSCTVYLELQRD